MKFVLLLLAVLLAIISNSFAAVSRGYLSDPNHPGKCVIRPDLIISEGKTITDPSGCVRIICGSNGFVTFQSCGVVGIGNDCRFGKILHPDADYPKCCEREVLC